MRPWHISTTLALTLALTTYTPPTTTPTPPATPPTQTHQTLTVPKNPKNYTPPQPTIYVTANPTPKPEPTTSPKTKNQQPKPNPKPTPNTTTPPKPHTKKAPTKPPTQKPNLKETTTQKLHTYPRTKNLTINWDHPILDGHLGAVETYNHPNTIFLNYQRLKNQPHLTTSVLLHELAHIYQRQLTDKIGIEYYDLLPHLEPAYGTNGIEEAADCTARALGATHTFYTTNCDSPQKQKWVTAILNNTPPPDLTPTPLTHSSQSHPKPDPSTDP